MIFRKQLQSNDCWRTAIGCLTDTEPGDVPFFFNPDNESFTELENMEVRKWFQERGLDIITINFHTPDSSPQDIMDHVQYLHGPDIVYMLVGMSVLEPHVVICRGNKILWDPSPVNSWIRGPIDGHYWIHYIAQSFMRYNGPMPENLIPFLIKDNADEDAIIL